MQNNPNQEIHTNYVANDVFKPVNANQLANSIHYDFVITQEMLDNYREQHPTDTKLDVGSLIASNISGTDGSWENPINAPVSIYIAAKTSLDDEFTFVFGGRLCGNSSSTFTPIVDCGETWDTPDAEDLINVYSAYPYRVEALVGGINHWSTPVTRIRLTGSNSQSGIVKIGSYRLDTSTTINRPDNFMLVIQGSSDNGIRFIYPWNLDHSSNDYEMPDFGNYRPSVIHANWMSGGGVSESYLINGDDLTKPSKFVNGLYAQIRQTILMGSEPVLTVAHHYASSRYQFSGWDSYEVRFSNLDVGNVVSVHKDGAITWRTAAGTGGGGDGGRVIITDFNPSNVPHVKRDGSDRVSTSMYSSEYDWEKVCVVRGGTPAFLSVAQDLGLNVEYDVFYSQSAYGFDFKGSTRLDWYFWYGINDYTYDTGVEAPTIQWFFNNNNSLYIDTAKLVEGLIYEINAYIIKLPIASFSEKGSTVNIQATPAYSFESDVSPSTPSLQFYTKEGVGTPLRYWGDTIGGHIGWNNGVYIGFHDNTEASNYPLQSVGYKDTPLNKNLDILAFGKVTFVKLQGCIYIMSY